ncbi:MAG: hypothetical protein Q7Q71_11340 [Verrucomicrobiota bacterium JB023]|nr:hypothetical protein [Verrucomicrobiota bacterium JB023]
MRTATLLTAALTGTLAAGTSSVPHTPMAPMPEVDAFASIRRPITNPTLFDLALPRTQVHGIYMHHRFPDQLSTSIGDVPFGGDLNLYALQFEIALSERLSIVAMKDGYVDFNPENTFTQEEGFANVGGGLKYAFLYDPANHFVVSTSAMFEFAIGDEDVFQGAGDGLVNLTLQGVKLADRWQFAAGTGVQLPLDDSFATQGFLSAHISYEAHPWFIPLVEANWFHVFDEGDGGSRFDAQVGGAVPAVAPSEGADLLNWGASDSTDYVTMGIGFRSRLTEQFSVGFAYEFPLTDEDSNITEDRWTIDALWRF